MRALRTVSVLALVLPLAAGCSSGGDSNAQSSSSSVVRSNMPSSTPSTTSSASTSTEVETGPTPTMPSGARATDAAPDVAKASRSNPDSVALTYLLTTQVPRVDDASRADAYTRAVPLTSGLAKSQNESDGELNSNISDAVWSKVKGSRANASLRYMPTTSSVPDTDTTKYRCFDVERSWSDGTHEPMFNTCMTLEKSGSNWLVSSVSNVSSAD